MGNRAVIVSKNSVIEINGRKAINPYAIGVYLHWNGGRDSVEGFLAYCDIQGYRMPSADRSYGFARLTQTIANYFDSGLSVGVDLAMNLDCDNWDNGVYIIDRWNIVDRMYFDGEEQTDYPLRDMLIEINNKQPAGIQVTEEEIDKYIEKMNTPFN